MICQNRIFKIKQQLVIKLNFTLVDARSTPKLSTMIYGGSNNPMITCLLRETHLNSFDAISTQFWWILFFHAMITDNFKNTSEMFMYNKWVNLPNI